jgi:hypothetical protein
MDEDPVVHGEAASPPRIEQIDPLLGDITGSCGWDL